MSIFDALVPALGWSLLHFLWQGLLVGLVASLLLSLLRNARPQARYLVACLALLACLLLPLAGTWHALQGDGLAAADTASIASAMTTLPATATSSGIDITGLQAELHRHLPWIVALWSLGTGLLTLRLLLGLAWVENLQRRGHETADQHWQQRLQSLARRLSLRRPVRLLVADGLDSPVALGILRPVVILPAALLARLPADLIEALLAHELAHVRRHDYLVNLLQNLVEALLFYHPVVWWLSRRIRSEREQIADDLAAAALGEPRRLALALNELEGFQSATTLVPAAHGGDLMNRIQRLLRPRPQALGLKAILPVLALALAGLAVSARGPEAGASPEAKASATARQGASARSRLLPSDAEVARESFAFVEAGRDGITLSGDLSDIAEIKRAKAAVQGDFLWFRHEGKTYVLQDRDLLQQVRQAWQPMRALDGKMQALESEMRPHEREIEQLSARIEAASAGEDSHMAAVEAQAEKMEALSREHEALLARLESGQERHDRSDSPQERDELARSLARLEAQRGQLQRQGEVIARQMEAEQARLEAALAPLEALGKQIELASQPMEAIAKRMEALGREHEKLAQLAEANVQAVIERAIREGRARPADEAQSR